MDTCNQKDIDLIHYNQRVQNEKGTAILACQRNLFCKLRIPKFKNPGSPANYSLLIFPQKAKGIF